MRDVPIELVVAAFPDEKAAGEALEALREAKREKLIGILDAAVIRRDDEDKLHIKETGDPGGGKGAGVGAVLGGIIGLLGGPPGVIVGGAAGALVGGLTARAVDSGFSDERLKEIGEALKPGTSAIVAVIEHRWVGEIEQQLAEYGADVLTEALKEDIAEQLEAGKDVAYSVTGDEEGIAFGRAVADEDEALPEE